MLLLPLLDASGAQALAEFVEQARLEGARVIVSGVQPQPRAMLGRIGLGEAAGRIAYAADYASAQVHAVDLAGAQWRQFPHEASRCGSRSRSEEHTFELKYIMRSS